MASPTRISEPTVAYCPGCKNMQELAAGEYWPAFCICGRLLKVEPPQCEGADNPCAPLEAE